MRTVALLVGAAGGLAGLLIARSMAVRPPSPQDQPLDPYAPHEPATGCDPTPKPGVLAFRAWFLGRWPEHPGSPQNVLRDCAIGSASEHWEGRAWDWMISSPESAHAAIDALLAPGPMGPHELARRAGIMYLIYNRQQWRAYPWQGQPSGSWGPYTGPNPHTDHIHFSFSKAGAAGQTSLQRSLNAIA